jgi:hypothetical protein
VDVTGTNLGLTTTDVVLTYMGGSDDMAQRTYTAVTCTIVAPGTHIRCSTVAGVGANYTFTVTVGGGGSAPSTQRLSYAAPVLNNVGGPGAVGCPAAGGVHILLHGVRATTTWWTHGAVLAGGNLRLSRSCFNCGFNAVMWV